MQCVAIATSPGRSIQSKGSSSGGSTRRAGIPAAPDVAWTQDDLAATLTEVLGTPITVARVTPEQQASILLDAGLDEGTAGFVTAIDAATEKGELALVTGDLSSLLGRPTTPLAETLRALA